MFRNTKQALDPHGTKNRRPHCSSLMTFAAYIAKLQDYIYGKAHIRQFPGETEEIHIQEPV